MVGRFFGEPGNSIDVRPDREDVGDHFLAGDANHVLFIEFCIDYRFTYAGLERDEVAVRLKPDDVIGAHGAQQILVTRCGTQGLVARERRMQEEADRVADPCVAELPGQGYQVIVVYPDQVVGLDQTSQLAGKLCVHPAIGIEVGRIVAQEIEQVMTYRP